jgi:hypothetical protein
MKVLADIFRALPAWALQSKKGAIRLSYAMKL